MPQLLAGAPGHGPVSLPSSSSSSHLVRCCVRCWIPEAGRRGNLQNALFAAAEKEHRTLRRGIVGVISDLMFDPAPVQPSSAACWPRDTRCSCSRCATRRKRKFSLQPLGKFGDLENAAVKHRLDAVTLKRLLSRKNTRAC